MGCIMIENFSRDSVGLRWEVFGWDCDEECLSCDWLDCDGVSIVLGWICGGRFLSLDWLGFDKECGELRFVGLW